MKKNDKFMLVLGVVVLAVFFGSIFAGAKELKAQRIATENHVSSIAEIAIPDVPAVTALRENGVITAEEWSTYYPAIYESWYANTENTGSEGGRVEYTEQNPDIQTLYQGMAFSFAYSEAVGHSYTLEDISATERPHKLANCLTCKTADFTALVNELGKDAYKLTFEEVFSNVSENVSCYSCHGNTPGTMVISSDYMAEAMNDEIASGDANAIDVACAQCHIEYYFDPETKATSVPYTGTADFDPDSILAFYNEMGFSDYTNENTGVGQIKVQHPEFETYLGEGSVHAGTFTCADCHMGVSYDDDGSAYVNHKFTSPLDNAELQKETCSVCHSDLNAMVEGIQAEVTARENEISAKLVELNSKLAAAVAEGKLSEAKLEEIKQLNRDAQFYWDFSYVENSEGAHNSTLANYVLDKADELVTKALGML